MLHREVGASDDTGTEEEPLDVVSLVGVEGQGDDLFGSEAGAPHIAGAAVDTVVADPHSPSGSNALASGGVFTIGS